MKWIELQLSRGDIALLIDSLLELKFRTYYLRIEAEGNGNRKMFEECTSKIKAIEQRIEYLDNMLY